MLIFNPGQHIDKVIDSLRVLPLPVELLALGDALRSGGREQDPPLLTDNQSVPSRGAERVNVYCCAASLGPNEPPAVWGPALLSHQSKEILPEILRDSVVLEELLGNGIVVKRTLKNIEGGVVCIGTAVLEEVREFQSESLATIRLATFEGSGEECTLVLCERSCLSFFR